MTEPLTPLPPPPPLPQGVEAPTPSRLPLGVAVAALLATAVMGLLWLGARSSGNDATIERDAAIAERDAANDATIDANAQMRTAQDELADTQAALDDASGAADQSDGPSPEEMQALEDRAEELSAEVERLEDQNEALAADLETAITESAATTVAEPETTAPSTSTTTTTTTTTTSPAQPAPDTTVAVPVSPDDIGDQISGLFRRSVLGAEQKSCLGQVVLNDLGEQRVVEAIAAESPGEDEEFVEAVRAAAEFCNIDPSAVFG